MKTSGGKKKRAPTPPKAVDETLKEGRARGQKMPTLGTLWWPCPLCGHMHTNSHPWTWKNTRTHLGWLLRPMRASFLIVVKATDFFGSIAD